MLIGFVLVSMGHYLIPRHYNIGNYTNLVLFTWFDTHNIPSVFGLAVNYFSFDFWVSYLHN